MRPHFGHLIRSFIAGIWSKSGETVVFATFLFGGWMISWQVIVWWENWCIFKVREHVANYTTNCGADDGGQQIVSV